MLLYTLQVICTFPATLVMSKHSELTPHLQFNMHRPLFSGLWPKHVFSQHVQKVAVLSSPGK